MLIIAQRDGVGHLSKADDRYRLFNNILPIASAKGGNYKVFIRNGIMS
jgi:hypothetical protein